MSKALETAFKVRREKGVHVGPILSAVPGRTDKHEMSVPSGAYVINADTVSHLGQNNTVAGLKVCEDVFGPHGKYAKGARGVEGLPQRAAGGRAMTESVPIMSAGGEYVIAPNIVTAIGSGDLARGHKLLDEWMVKMRKHHIKTLKALPGPAKR